MSPKVIRPQLYFIAYIAIPVVRYKQHRWLPVIAFAQQKSKEAGMSATSSSRPVHALLQKHSIDCNMRFEQLMLM